MSPESSRPLFVVNPRSGGGKTGATWGNLQSTIEARLGKIDVVFTERTMHAADLAKEGAEKGHPLVVAVGGDGTFNEVVNGLLSAGRPETRIGMVAQGTGGDFRKTLGFEHKLDAYLEALASGRERKLDVGRLEYTDSSGATQTRHFVNILSCGMGGLVDQYVATAPRVLGGTAAYFLSSFRGLLGSKVGRVRCRVVCDGTSEERTIHSLMIAICNGQYFGSGMHVAPMAKPDDGYFELVALGATSKVEFALTSSSIYSGAHMKRADTVHMRGQSFTLTLENQEARDVYLLDLDGEPVGRLPITITLLPGAVTLRG